MWGVLKDGTNVPHPAPTNRYPRRTGNEVRGLCERRGKTITGKYGG